MSNFTLGRIGLDADIDDVSQWDASGETVTVSFSTPSIGEGGSLARSNAYRQMIIGYADSPDQKFVPVTWADDPTVDGYYRVRSASVTPDPDLGLDGLYYFTATLERVLGYGMPMIQTTYLFRARTTVHAPSAAAYLASPSAGTKWGYAYEPEDGTYSNQSPTRFPTTEDGTVGVVLASVTGGSGPSSGELALWNRNIDPDQYYVGSPRLEVDGYPVEGRQIPRNWQGNWRLTNGTIELMMDADGVTNGDVIFQMRAWNGVTWSDPTPISIIGDDSATTPRDVMNGPDTLTVIRNTAEEVTIRLAMHVGSRNWPAFLDITCRRGLRTFDCRYRRASGTGSANIAVKFDNHLTDYGWRREGAWVSAGPESDRQFVWNPRASVDDNYWDRYNATGTATGRITMSAISSGTITTAFRVTASAAHGPTAFGVEHGAVGSNTPNSGITATTQYTFAAWVRTSVARSLQLQVQWKTSAGANLTTAQSADTAVAANTWTRITFTATAPATAARFSLRVRGVSGGANWALNDTLDVTGLQCEVGATVGNFWDGDGGGGSDALNDMWTYQDAPDTPSIRQDRTSDPTIWFVSPIATVADTDAWEPDPGVSADPATWYFGFGMIAAGYSSGDTNRYIGEVNAYFMAVTQSDEVVAV